jgi:hypothetical protein
MAKFLRISPENFRKNAVARFFVVFFDGFGDFFGSRESANMGIFFVARPRPAVFLVGLVFLDVFLEKKLAFSAAFWLFVDVFRALRSVFGLSFCVRKSQSEGTSCGFVEFGNAHFSQRFARKKSRKSTKML